MVCLGVHECVYEMDTLYRLHGFKLDQVTINKATYVRYMFTAHKVFYDAQ